jgi:excisionase family DNA binding protein
VGYCNIVVEVIALMQLLTVAETAELLQVTNYRVYTLARTGLMPGVVRLGRQLRFDGVRLSEFIRQGGACGPLTRVAAKVKGPAAPAT